MKSGASDPFGDEANEEREEEGGEATPPSDDAETAASPVDEEQPQLADEESRPADEQSRPADEESVRTDKSQSSEQTGDETASGDATLDRSQIPYTLRRDNVKDERPHVHQLFVRDETDDAARAAERDLEDVLDTDVYRLDAREAIYLVGMRHPEEVAELLEEWGYNF